VPDEPVLATPGAFSPEVKGEIRVDDLRVGPLTVRAFQARVIKAKGDLAFEEVSGRLHEGALAAGALLHLFEPGPPVTVQGTVKGVKVADLLKEISPFTRFEITGLLDFDADGSGRGAAPETWRGTIRADLREGRLVGHPAQKTLAALFRSPELEKFDLTRCHLEASVFEGVAQVSVLEVESPVIRMKGHGRLGLLDETLGLTLDMAVPQEIAGRLIRDRRLLGMLTEKGGWSRLRFQLGGTFEAPAWRLDSDDITRRVTEGLAGNMNKGKGDGTNPWRNFLDLFKGK
jgi:AsmA protein